MKNNIILGIGTIKVIISIILLSTLSLITIMFILRRQPGAQI